jgi:uncharacterized cupredoxin-like copper-binding protein
MMGAGVRPEQAPAPVPGAPEVEILARDFTFSPTEVAVPAGATVNLVLMNDGDLAHDITIPAVGFRVAALPGTRVSASLTAGPGEYEFFCSVAGHRDAGMEGVIVAT